MKDSQKTAQELNLSTEQDIDRTIEQLSDLLIENCDAILIENKKDLLKLSTQDPLYDRLLLTPKRIQEMAKDLKLIAKQKSPIGEVLETNIRPNGIEIQKIRVPLGVIGIIFEARPNVCIDVFALCVKTKNVSVLKGSRHAQNSNEILVSLIHKALRSQRLNPKICTLLSSDDTQKMLEGVGMIDVIIPRGGQNLINFVRQNSKIPVIETGAGICHTYFDKMGDLKIGTQIIHNAKCRRPSVCNSLDCLVIHKDRLSDLNTICKPLMDQNVVIWADDQSYDILQNSYPENLLHKATPQSYGEEFLSLQLSIKTVFTINDAIEHITQYSSKHSECIISNSTEDVSFFNNQIDASCVYNNVSTAFTDGGEFGFGAEIGISTQKLHARGPMGLRELCSYKYLISGRGQVR